MFPDMYMNLKLAVVIALSTLSLLNYKICNQRVVDDMHFFMECCGLYLYTAIIRLGCDISLVLHITTHFVPAFERHPDKISAKNKSGLEISQNPKHLPEHHKSVHNFRKYIYAT